jgi:Transposase, Mutator family
MIGFAAQQLMEPEVVELTGGLREDGPRTPCSALWLPGRTWERRAGEGLRGRPIEDDWPYFWIDATYPNVRQDGRIVAVDVIFAVGVNSDGRRETFGMDIGYPKPRVRVRRGHLVRSF